jgi:N utilization substance protein B
MISRRILRIKIMQALYAYFKHNGESSLKKAEQELFFSIEKAFDLYHYLMILPIDIANYAESRIELAKHKKVPTYNDLNPNTKFIDNKIIFQIRINTSLLHYIKKKKMSWVVYPDLIKAIYNKTMESKCYAEYIEKIQCSYEEDKTFICTWFKDVVAQFDPLYQNLEEQSIYWNDEPEFIIGIIIKTIRKFMEKDGENSMLLPLYKSREDKEYAKKLLHMVVFNNKEYLDLIEQFSKNWDIDRIAFLDILLMQMAIAEAVEFSSIPVKVTLNEYLELAKYYSTAKSNIFINGVLDKIFIHLKDKNQIKKQGRGLIGEI